MATVARKRVTIDLRGIGDAVRAAAAERGATLAALARQALLDAAGPDRAGTSLRFASLGPARRIVKFTLRLRQPAAETLFLRAGVLGLSYGEYVSKLVNGTTLPMPVAERDADRAALRASTDQLAALSNATSTSPPHSWPGPSDVKGLDMPNPTSLDGILVQWGDRLFYPPNRMVRASAPYLTGAALRERAAAVRQRIHATHRRCPLCVPPCSNAFRSRSLRA